MTGVSRGPIILDGAWGTELYRLGLAPGGCADSWNLLCPHAVEAVARSYVAAGSQLILTNTFQANKSSLTAHGLCRQRWEINRAGVAISKLAAGDRVRVFGSIGPVGGADEAAYRDQAEALAYAGADGLVLETMTRIEEARIGVKAAKSTGLTVFVSFAFVAGTKLTPEDAAMAMTDAGADGVGVNCDAGTHGFFEIVKRMRAACDLPLWCKPSAGLPDSRISPEQFAEKAKELISAGVDKIGGCCGAGPDFIRTLAKALEPRV